MKFLGSIAVNRLSGSQGGVTASHNKGGQYFRARATPTTVTTDAALAQKQRIANQSQGWAARTDAERNAWTAWGQQNPGTDTFGNQFLMTGHQAYVRINAKLQQSGDTLLTLPPVGDAPDGLLTFSGTYDIGLGDVSVIFTDTPLGAAVKLQIWAAVVDSAGITFVTNLYKLILYSAVALVSPLVIDTEVQARWGTLQEGQVLHLRAATFDTLTGLVSPLSHTKGTIIST